MFQKYFALFQMFLTVSVSYGDFILQCSENISNCFWSRPNQPDFSGNTWEYCPSFVKKLISENSTSGFALIVRFILYKNCKELIPD